MTVIDAMPTTTSTRVGAISTDIIEAIRGVIERHAVTMPEYHAATAWLVQLGEQGEVPLLLDVFFATTLDDLNTSADGGTETNIEGPFYLPDAALLEAPHVLPHRPDEPGERLVFSGTVRAVDGAPLAGAIVDVWQANGAGEYSHFSPGTPDGNLRGRLATDTDGRFSLETVVPSSYEIPSGGPTGQLLRSLGRHCFRPAHLHVKASHPDARPLTTQIYLAGDPLIDSDVVGAVKAPLVAQVDHHEDGDGRGHATCSFDIVLPGAR